MTRKLLLAGLALAAMMIAAPANAAAMEPAEGFSVSLDYAYVSGPAPVPPVPQPAPVAIAPVAIAPTAMVAPLAEAAPAAEIAEADLDALAGQGDAPVAVLTEQTLTALNSGNSINAGTVGSGTIALDQNAFSGFDGIGNFVINTGHNNTLQSSLSVSIVITN